VNYDDVVPGPGSLDMLASTRNEKMVTSWWEGVKLYAESMRDLDRAVVLCYVPDEDRYYLGSVPVQETTDA